MPTKELRTCHAIFNNIYNFGNLDCTYFSWHEGQSKRGASEICTAVYKALQFYERDGIKKAYLFCDGCSGQN